MGQFLNFGNGSAGILNITSNTTASFTWASGSGSSGSKSLTATASFSAGDIVLIHQSRGTGAGNWEINQVSSYTTGTVTLTNNMSYTYTDSGASQCQVIKLPQYSGVNITANYTVPNWDGSVGGILPILCNGRVYINGGQIIADGLVGSRSTNSADGFNAEGGLGAGFWGGRGLREGSHVDSEKGEGYPTARFVGLGTNEIPNGNGGCGLGFNNSNLNGGGGGGGNGTAGEGGNLGVVGGTVYNNATLTQMTFGGGGGGGGNGHNNSADVSGGGGGGGIIMIFAREIVCSNGYLLSRGGAGGNSSSADYQGRVASGGGGAGGSILLKAQTLNIGTDRIRTEGGDGPDSAGTGGKGRIRLETCSLTGSVSSTYYGSYSTSIGGHSYCGILTGMI
jgi:large repetitive protein